MKRHDGKGEKKKSRWVENKKRDEDMEKWL
jgi:hypothetical protein